MYFILIYTSSAHILDKAKNLYSKAASHKVERQSAGKELIIYSNTELHPCNVVSAINRVDDIDSEGSSFLGNDHDSVISKFSYNENRAVFVTDHWGLMPFYYYEQEGIFMISNNIFLIQKLVGSDISREAVYESMLFKKPLKRKSWYSSINVSIPNEKIIVDFHLDQVSRSDGGISPSLFGCERTDYVEEATCFFDHAFKYLDKCNNETIAVSLSAGSDSRTVLAGVLSAARDFTAYSWGGHYYVETKRIRKLVKKFGIKWVLTEFDKFHDQEHQIIVKSQLSSNGLAPSKHFFYHYRSISPNIALFEGYGGSELFKTELSDGMWTEPYKTLITEKVSSVSYLGEYFFPIAPGYRAEMINYLHDEFADYLTNVNTPHGFQMHRNYVLDLIPGRVFNGVFNSAIYQGLLLYEPFFSRKILSS